MRSPFVPELITWMLKAPKCAHTSTRVSRPLFPVMLDIGLISVCRLPWRSSAAARSGTCSMLSAIRAPQPCVGVVPHHVDAVWIVVSGGAASTAPASCRRNLRRLLKATAPFACSSSTCRRTSSISSSSLAPNMCVKKTAPRLTCPAASRRRTAPSSCGAAGGDALNAVGHFVVVYRPTAHT